MKNVEDEEKLLPKKKKKTQIVDDDMLTICQDMLNLTKKFVSL